MLRKRKWMSLPIHSENEKMENNLMFNIQCLGNIDFFRQSCNSRLLSMTSTLVVFFAERNEPSWAFKGVSGRCNVAIWLENFQSHCYSCAGTFPFIFSLIDKVEKFREIKANWRDCLLPEKFNKLFTSLLNICTQSSLVEMYFQLPVTPV